MTSPDPDRPRVVVVEKKDDEETPTRLAIFILVFALGLLAILIFVPAIEPILGFGGLVIAAVATARRRGKGLIAGVVLCVVLGVGLVAWVISYVR